MMLEKEGPSTAGDCQSKDQLGDRQEHVNYAHQEVIDSASAHRRNASNHRARKQE